VTRGFTTEASSLSTVRATNIAGTGSMSMTVQGGGMGLSVHTAEGRRGPTACEATTWESDSSARCHVGGGQLGSRRLSMSVGLAGAGSMSQGQSIDLAGLSQVRGSNRATTGSASVTVSGWRLGNVGHSGAGRAMQSSCEGTVWLSDSSVVCNFGGGWLGRGRVLLTSGERRLAALIVISLWRCCDAAAAVAWFCAFFC
jgi:hypothetical protein